MCSGRRIDSLVCGVKKQKKGFIFPAKKNGNKKKKVIIKEDTKKVERKKKGNSWGKDAKEEGFFKGRGVFLVNNKWK